MAFDLLDNVCKHHDKAGFLIGATITGQKSPEKFDRTIGSSSIKSGSDWLISQ